MGGRGSKSGVNDKLPSGGEGSDKIGRQAMPTRTKYTSEQLKQMSRKKLETIALSIAIERGVKQGLSASEASYRARSLMPSNTTPQLRKYIKRYG